MFSFTQELHREFKRQHQEQVLATYADLEVPPTAKDTSDYEAISKAWLVRYFEASIKEEVPPIDNGPLLCAHGKLALAAGGVPFRVIRSSAAEGLYALYGGGPRLAPLAEHYCPVCVSATVELATLKAQLDADDKLIKALGPRGAGRPRIAKVVPSLAECAGTRQYLIGKESFKIWRNLKMASVKAKHTNGAVAVNGDSKGGDEDVVILDEEKENADEQGSTSSNGNNGQLPLFVFFLFF